jgi:hypothetical protein
VPEILPPQMAAPQKTASVGVCSGKAGAGTVPSGPAIQQNDQAAT